MTTMTTFYLLGGVVTEILPLPHLAGEVIDVQRKRCVRCAGRCPPPHIKLLHARAMPDGVSCSYFISCYATVESLS